MSQEAWNRRKGCVQKKGFKHQGQARREAHKQGMKNVYECSYCGDWHMTSKVRKQEDGTDE